MTRTLTRTLAVVALGFILTSSLVSAQISRMKEDRKLDRSPLPARLDPMNPPAKAQLQAVTLDGDIDDLLGMVGNLGGLGCAFEVDDPAENITCSDPDFDPCSPKENEVGNSFYFVNGFDLTKGVVVYNAQTQEMWLGLRVVGCIGDVDGDGSPNTICPDGAASGINENFGIGSTDGYRWDFDLDCSPGDVFNRDAWVEVRGPTDMTTGNPSVDVTSNFTYSTIEVRWKGNGGVGSTEIEVKMTGVDLLTNFPDGGFDVKVFTGSEEDCLGENKSDPGRCEPPVPALSGRKTVDDVCAGEMTTATISVKNEGLVPFDLQVFDDLPAGHTYVGGSASGIGEPAPAGDDVLFTGPTLAPGDSTTFSFRIQTPAQCFGDVTNNATATGSYTSPCYLEDPDFRSTEFDFSADYTCLLNTAAPPIGDQTKCEGTDVTFTVSATGENLSYQWYKNADPNTPQTGTPIEGAVGPAYSLTDVSEVDEATYCVFVSGDCGTVWRCADLTVNPPTVAGDIGDQTQCEGENATFMVEASGLNLTYQWYKGGAEGNPETGSPIGGATDPSYTLTDVSEVDEAVYCVLVSGECGTVWRCADLTVNPPTAAGDIDDQTQCEGESATFTVEASGLGLTYQWYKGGTEGNPETGSPVEGATDPSYTLNDVEESDEAVYCVLVTGTCGSVWRCAMLTVNPGTVADDIDDETRCVDDGVTFTVNATGTNLFYQWYKGGNPATSQTGTPLETENESSLALTDLTEADAAVYCVYVSGDCGSVWKCAQLTVDEVQVTVDDVEACAGDEAALCPEVAGGTGPYAFSWTGPGGFTSPDSCISVDGGGEYTVTVTDVNGCGGTGSGTATFLEAALQVYAVNQSACVGETSSLSMVVKNTSGGTQDFSLECTIDGQPQSPIAVNGVAAGDSAVVPLEVRCVEGETVPVSCDVTASLVGSPGCTARAHADGEVVCLAPSVQITKTDNMGSSCAQDGQVITYTLEVRNTGPVDLTGIVVEDAIALPLAAYVGNSASADPVSQPADGGEGTLRWEAAGPLAPGAKLTYTYRLALAVTADCVGEAMYENKATVEAYCGEAGTTAEALEKTCITCPSCWMTGGGFLNEGQKKGHKEDNFGGNVGPPPSGSWQHVQRVDNKITFNFHSHDVGSIECYHDGGDGPCSPAAENNVIVFGGTGAYSTGNGPRRNAAVWTARVEDHGEPGNNPKRSGGCGSPDYYTIEVRDADTDDVVFTAGGFLDGGNFQLHKSTGRQFGGTAGIPIGLEVTLNAFPNPISSDNGTLRFNVPTRYADKRVEINLFDVSGRLVRKLVDGPRPAGLQTAHWDLRNDSGQRITAGIYFTRLRVGPEQRIIRMMVLSQN